MPNPIPPPPLGIAIDDDTWSQFFELIRRYINVPPTYSSTADPSVSDIPEGSWGVWKNTTSGTVKVWTNDGGVLKSVTLT